MLLEVSKAMSFLLSILSLYPVMMSAFFVPGARWEGLALAFYKIALAGCVCFASGLLFSWPSPESSKAQDSLMSTLPVRMFFWAVAGMGLLFLASWYLEEYYVPLLWRNQP